MPVPPSSAALAVLLAGCPRPPAKPTPEISAPAPSPSETSTPAGPETVLTVSSYRTGRVHVFDPTDGTLLGTVRGVNGAQTVVAGPSGEWIACAEELDQIVRIDPATLEIVGVLVGDDPDTPADETGGLDNPDAAVFGPDGRLYVSSFETDQVLRYEADGTFVDVFVPAGGGGLDGPDIGLGFGPDGELLVPGWYSDRVHRYDATTGEPLEDLLGPDDGLDRPRAIVTRPDGALLVSGWGTGGVLSVAPDGTVARLLDRERATGMVLGPGGELFVAADDNAVQIFDVSTGQDLGRRITLDRIDGPTAIALLPR